MIERLDIITYARPQNLYCLPVTTLVYTVRNAIKREILECARLRYARPRTLRAQGTAPLRRAVVF